MNQAIKHPWLDKIPPGPPACLLERILGRPACEWTLDDLVSLVADWGIEFVSLMHVGGDGSMKVLDFVPRDVQHLRDILEAGERADGSNLFPRMGLSTGSSDIVLSPRIQSAFLEPFAPRPTLALICSHEGQDGRPLPQSPDTILRRAFERARQELGFEAWALGEVEFFLGRSSLDLEIYGANDRGYHATAPFVFGEALRREALALLAQIGLPVKYAHSEAGYLEPVEGEATVWEQHEVELGLLPLPRAAEAVSLTHWVLRSLAQAMDYRCNFNPIVRPGHAGSGMHFHLSAVTEGRHLGVTDQEGQLQDPARWLIGGLTRLAPALMAFGNRTEDSFIRLGQAREAPHSVFWGQADRNALIRLPVVATTPDGRLVSPATVEFRLPDGTAHPQLLLAGIAQAWIHGSSLPDLDKQLELSAATGAARGRPHEPLPTRFEDVRQALIRDHGLLEAGDVFPSAMIEQVARSLGN